LQRQIKRLDRTGLEGGEALVEIQPLFRHQATGGPRLLRALFSHIHIPPAGEAIFQVPGRLAVTDKDESGHEARLLHIKPWVALPIAPEIAGASLSPCPFTPHCSRSSDRIALKRG